VASGKDVLYKSYEEVKALVVLSIAKLIRRTKGSAITFTAKKIAVAAGLPAQPIVLTLIKDVLENLCSEGLVEVYSKTSHGVKYMITRDSPLWSASIGEEFEIKTPYLKTIVPLLASSTGKF